MHCSKTDAFEVKLCQKLSYILDIAIEILFRVLYNEFACILWYFIFYKTLEILYSILILLFTGNENVQSFIRILLLALTLLQLLMKDQR